MAVVFRPELCRVGDVNQHRDFQPCAGLEQRIHSRVVDWYSPAGLVAHAHAEVLENLQPLRARLDIRFELPRRALGPAGTADTVEVRVGENGKALGVFGSECPHRVAEPVAMPAAEVHQDCQVERIHLAYDLVQSLRRG